MNSESTNRASSPESSRITSQSECTGQGTEQGKWEAVIGLEIHARLKTDSKLFSTSPSRYGAAPNEQANIVDVGLPGTLPVPNESAIRMAVAFGLAVGADIAPVTQFARKHYFYPDLPKGYQISQLDRPVTSGGIIKINVSGIEKSIRLVRAHLEEDAGRLVHDIGDGNSRVDLNRAGMPLIEIVSEPELHSAEEAGVYMKKVHEIVCNLDICDGNMQEGSLRCDANVSVRRAGEDTLGVRTEIKNLNSFRFIRKAINYEIRRQIALLEEGKPVIQQTRLYDADRNETRAMRGKEEAHDYRYFPDPDLPPIEIPVTLIEQVRAALPTMSDETRQHLIANYNLTPDEASAISHDTGLVAYFEQCARATQADNALTIKWVSGHIADALKNNQLTTGQSRISPQQLANLLDNIADGTLSDKIARDVFEKLWSEGGQVDDIIQSGGLRQISDTDKLQTMVEAVCKANPKQVKQYRAGKTKMLGFFVGQVMKETTGKANPGMVTELFKSFLER